MLSENPIRNERSKHIDYRVHSLRERVQEGEVTLVDCPTRDMIADTLTKALPSPTFTRHRDTMMGYTSHPLIQRYTRHIWPKQSTSMLITPSTMVSRARGSIVHGFDRHWFWPELKIRPTKHHHHQMETTNITTGINKHHYQPHQEWNRSVWSTDTIGR